MGIATLRKSCVMIVLILTGYSFAQPLDYDYVNQFGGSDKDYGHVVTVDEHGNYCITGWFQSTVDFGSGNELTSLGNYDFYVAKYDNAGALQWVKGGGGILTDRGDGMAIDATGNIIVAGSFYGVATFEDVALTSSGNLDVMTLKYSPTGELLWIKQGKCATQAKGVDIVVTPDGNYVETGYFGGNSGGEEIDFDGTVVQSNGFRDIYVLKRDPEGNILWAVNAGGPESGEVPSGIAADAAGNIYITGEHNDNAEFGSTILHTDSTDNNMVVAKLDPDGNFLWAKTAGGFYTDDQGYDIDVTPEGDVYVTGIFDSLATFEDVDIVGNDQEEFFLAKYDTDGNFQWVRHSVCPEKVFGYGVQVAPDGNVYAVGRYGDDATFGETQIDGIDADDIFIAKYSTDGDLLWIETAGGIDDDYAKSVDVDWAGNVYVTGNFLANCFIGDETLISNGKNDIFVAKLGDAWVPVELVAFEASVEGNEVTLQWSTATETNNAGFEVQKSSDGVTFSKIAFIDGAGTSTEMKYYSYTDTDCDEGTYYYRLKQVDQDGSFDYSNVTETNIHTPTEFTLNQNFPNPFNPSTTISFSLPEVANVVIDIYNSNGEQIRELVNSSYASGIHEVSFDASSLPSGIYLYKITVITASNNRLTDSKKMMLLK